MHLTPLISRTFAVAAALGLVVLGSAQAARADVAIEGGALIQRGQTSGEAGLALGLFSLPVVPLSGEVSVVGAAAGGYAATFDARLDLAGTTFGAGAGIGNFGNLGTTSVIYDGIVAQRIFPHTALQAKFYFGPNRASSLLAGLRISF